MKIDHILFPIDFSEQSRALNPEVEWLAARFNSSVTLLHVFEVPMGWYGGGESPLILEDEFRAYAESAQRRLKEYPIQIPASRIQRVSSEGSAPWHIANWTREHEIDLIVMGTHGYGPVRRFLLGSVAMKVLHDVRCPVWTHAMHPEKGTLLPGVSKMLCAIEPGEEAVPLLRFAKELSSQFAAPVRLIHTVPATTGPYKIALQHDLFEMAQEEIAKAQLQAGTEFPLTLTEQHIAQDIADLAHTEAADLVLIGRGKAGAAFGSLRTHAYEIIRQAPCPVLSYSVEPAVHSVAVAGEQVAQEVPK